MLIFNLGKAYGLGLLPQGHFVPKNGIQICNLPFHNTNDLSIRPQLARIHPPHYSLAAVDDDVLGPDAAFQHAHLGMVTSASEESGGLDAEVADALAVVVHQTEAVLLQDALILLFDFLKTNQHEKDI